ncbi:hypothetical protein ZWY2020_019152 [Hordeum vulgare]|nr:hypothetical protein ZWY2020_019152 [Hordeum vulgare]
MRFNVLMTGVDPTLEDDARALKAEEELLAWRRAAASRTEEAAAAAMPLPPPPPGEAEAAAAAVAYGEAAPVAGEEAAAYRLPLITSGPQPGQVPPPRPDLRCPSASWTPTAGLHEIAQDDLFSTLMDMDWKIAGRRFNASRPRRRPLAKTPTKHRHKGSLDGFALGCGGSGPAGRRRGGGLFTTKRRLRRPYLSESSSRARPHDPKCAKRVGHTDVGEFCMAKAEAHRRGHAARDTDFGEKGEGSNADQECGGEISTSSPPTEDFMEPDSRHETKLSLVIGQAWAASVALPQPLKPPQLPAARQFPPAPASLRQLGWPGLSWANSTCTAGLSLQPGHFRRSFSPHPAPPPSRTSHQD